MVDARLVWIPRLSNEKDASVNVNDSPIRNSEIELLSKATQNNVENDEEMEIAGELLPAEEEYSPDTTSQRVIESICEMKFSKTTGEQRFDGSRIQNRRTR